MVVVCEVVLSSPERFSQEIVPTKWDWQRHHSPDYRLVYHQNDSEAVTFGEKKSPNVAESKQEVIFFYLSPKQGGFSFMLTQISDFRLKIYRYSTASGNAERVLYTDIFW